MLNRLPDHDKLYAHILRRDPELDGVIYVGVKTTGIFCRPVCPARTPLSKNITFYGSPDEALAAGFRPCKRCRPLDDPNAPGVLHRQAPAACRGRSLPPLERGRPARHGHRARNGAPPFPEALRHELLAVCAGAPSGPCLQHHQERRRGDRGAAGCGLRIRQRFPRSLRATVRRGAQQVARGARPSRWTGSTRRWGRCWRSPTTRTSTCWSSSSARSCRSTSTAIARQFNATVLPGDTKALKLIRKELADYFAGKNLKFTSKIAGAGTDFQNQVWDELRRVPPGVTRSYQEMAATHRPARQPCARSPTPTG